MIGRSIFTSVLLHFCVLLFTVNGKEIYCKEQLPKVAVVGAGIGGAATSYFLSELLNKEQICVDMYEVNTVGGRIATVLINGSRFDSGAAVIHDANYYLTYFKDLLGLERRNFNSDGTLGFYNGKDFIPLKDSSSAFNFLKSFWRYGFQIFNVDSYLDKVLSKFGRIYEYQKKMKSFDNVQDMLQSLDQDLPNMLTISIKDALIKEGFSELFINEVVGSAVYRDFNLGTSVHQFLGTIAMVISQPQLWAVEGGNVKVVEGLVKKSDANLIPHGVEEIHLNADDTFNLFANNVSKTYNFVVLAGPLTKDHSYPIVFKQFPGEIVDPGHFHRSISTIIHGKLNYKYFRLSEEKDIPKAILNIGGSFFNSINKIKPVESKGNQMNDVYNIISHQFLTEQNLEDLFLEISEVRVLDWLANPYYDTSKRKDTFVLHKNMFYINAIEWVSSGMEFSCLSAKNIALLIYKNLFPEKVPKSQLSESKLHKESVNNEL